MAKLLALGIANAVIAAFDSEQLFDASDSSIAQVRAPSWTPQFKWTLDEIKVPDDETVAVETISYAYVDTVQGYSLTQVGDEHGELESTLEFGGHKYGWENFDANLVSLKSPLTGNPIAPVITADLIKQDKDELIQKAAQYCSNKPACDYHPITGEKTNKPCCDCQTKSVPPVRAGDLTLLPQEHEYLASLLDDAGKPKECKYKSTAGESAAQPTLILAKEDACPSHPTQNASTCLYWSFVENGEEVAVYVETNESDATERIAIAIISDEQTHLILETETTLSSDAFGLPAPCLESDLTDWNDESKSVQVTLETVPMLQGGGRAKPELQVALSTITLGVNILIAPCVTYPNYYLGVHCPWTPSWTQMMAMALNINVPPFLAAAIQAISIKYPIGGPINPDLFMAWPQLPSMYGFMGFNGKYGIKYDNMFPPSRLWGSPWHGRKNEYDNSDLEDFDYSGVKGACTGAPSYYDDAKNVRTGLVTNKPWKEIHPLPGPFNDNKDNNHYVSWRFNGLSNKSKPGKEDSPWGTVGQPEKTSNNLIKHTHYYTKKGGKNVIITDRDLHGYGEDSPRWGRQATDRIPAGLSKYSSRYLYEDMNALPSIGTNQQRLTRCNALAGMVDTDFKEFDTPVSSTKKGKPIGLAAPTVWKYSPNMLSDAYVARQHDFSPIGQSDSTLSCAIDGVLYKHSTRALPLILMGPWFFGHPCFNLKWKCRARKWLGCHRAADGGGRLWKWAKVRLNKYKPMWNSGYKIWGPVGRASPAQALCAPLRMTAEGHKDVGDGVCDCALNKPEFGYDGGDCCKTTCTFEAGSLGQRGIARCRNFHCLQPKCHRMSENKPSTTVSIGQKCRGVSGTSAIPPNQVFDPPVDPKKCIDWKVVDQEIQDGKFKGFGDQVLYDTEIETAWNPVFSSTDTAQGKTGSVFLDWLVALSKKPQQSQQQITADWKSFAGDATGTGDALATGHN